MSFHGIYYASGVTAPGVERTAPRPQDRPVYGLLLRACLAALKEPRTISDVAGLLRHDRDAVKSCVLKLQRHGVVRRVGTQPGPVPTRRRGRQQQVACYQRVSR